MPETLLMEINMNNTKLATHPFAQISSADIEQVNGGNRIPNFKAVTMAYPEDGISNIFTEDGNGPIYTTLAIYEDGGSDLPLEF
jgi:hypothetical protein